MFHALVVRKEYVDLGFHRGDADLARRKHVALLLSQKLCRFATDGKVYRVRVDPIPSSYAKADEAVLVLANRWLHRRLGLRPVDDLRTCDSKRTLGIQVCDVLTGAVLDAWEGAGDRPKRRLKGEVARHLGWDDLRHDTWPSEWKFNVWYLKDPKDGLPREPATQPVRLLYPMPALQVRAQVRAA